MVSVKRSSFMVLRSSIRMRSTVDHPGTLLVHDGAVVVHVMVPRRLDALTQRDRAGDVPAEEDGAPVVPQEVEVLVVAVPDRLHVPQTRELREAFAQPAVVVGHEVHADSPPLM